jgi:superfamily II helicase
MDKYKVCKQCQDKKPAQEFAKNQFPELGRKDICKRCDSPKLTAGRAWAVNTLRTMELNQYDY